MTSDLSRFLHLAFSGRALLLSGQDLAPGTSERLSTLIASRLNREPNGSLGDLCTRLGDADAILQAAASLAFGGSDPALLRIAGVPWAAVFTSALDDAFSNELSRQDSQGRRLRHL